MIKTEWYPSPCLAFPLPFASLLLSLACPLGEVEVLAVKPGQIVPIAPAGWSPHARQPHWQMPSIL